MSSQKKTGGKVLYCHERVAGVAMGLHIFKQTKKNQKKANTYFLQYQGSKTAFISKKMVSEKFEPGKKLESAICNLYPFKRK